MQGKEILVTHNPLLRQYLKQQANDDVYRLYGKTQERRGKAEKGEKERTFIMMDMDTDSRNIII